MTPTVLDFLRFVCPAVAFICAIAMACVGTYAALEERIAPAVCGIGGAMATTSLAVPMFHLRRPDAMLNESLVLVLGSLGVVVAYLAITQTIYLVRTANYYRDQITRIAWNLPAPAAYKPVGAHRI
jgi:hypothetical protein